MPKCKSVLLRVGSIFVGVFSVFLFLLIIVSAIGLFTSDAFIFVIMWPFSLTEATFFQRALICSQAILRVGVFMFGWIGIEFAIGIGGVFFTYKLYALASFLKESKDA